jgi:hypothetical protein
MLVCLACVVYLALGAFLVWYEWLVANRAIMA